MILAPIQNMDEAQIAKVETSVLRFTDWLDRYGETSYDHQSYFASDLARAVKALYYKKPLLGTLRGLPDDILRGFFAFGPQTLLEATEISHCGRPLRHGFRLPLPRSRTETIL